MAVLDPRSAATSCNQVAQPVAQPNATRCNQVAQPVATAPAVLDPVHLVDAATATVARIRPRILAVRTPSPVQVMSSDNVNPGMSERL